MTWWPHVPQAEPPPPFASPAVGACSRVAVSRSCLADKAGERSSRQPAGQQPMGPSGAVASGRRCAASAATQVTKDFTSA
jgi:hypothetical protein